VAGGEAPLENIATFKLLDAFRACSSAPSTRASIRSTSSAFSLSEKISELSDLLRQGRRLVFHEIFGERSSRAELIITFLALLEMTRLRLTRLTQDGPLAADLHRAHRRGRGGRYNRDGRRRPPRPPTGEPGLPDRGDSEEYE
jgi:chromatin segregation and condensation protein Rec8/ScpA/Scc1 (kleisin family)